MSADFVELPVSGRVNKISVEQSVEGATHVTPDINAIAGVAGPEFERLVLQSDTIALFWNGSMTCYTATGGQQWIVFPDKKVVRGVMQFPVNFFGLLDINSQNDLPPIVVMHEFFHVIEAKLKITPHGYYPSNRSKFPDWKGTEQLDYYRWQFAANFPSLLGAKGYTALQMHE